MATRIDFEKSIKTDRLCWKRDLEGKFQLVLNYFFWGLLIIILIGGPIHLSIKDIKEGTFGGLSPIFYFTSLTFGLLLLYGLSKIFKLRRVKGKDSETNRLVITRLLKRDFPKINEDATGTKILTIKKPFGLFNFGQRVTVLFDNEDILINILTIGRHDIPSLFHAVSNDDNVKSLIKEFRHSINKT